MLLTLQQNTDDLLPGITSGFPTFWMVHGELHYVESLSSIFNLDLSRPAVCGDTLSVLGMLRPLAVESTQVVRGTAETAGLSG